MFSLQNNVFMQYLFFFLLLFLFCFLFCLRLRLFIWWIDLRYASNFIHNKGHIFMNFDGMINILHMDPVWYIV